MTGLPNRRRLNLDLVERIGPAIRAGTPYALAMVDIDHFKRFNDDYGHKVGDITLQRVAALLTGALRAEDAVYRYGGEEFTLAVAAADPATASRLLERIRAAVAEAPQVDADGRPVPAVTVSIGAALAPRNSVDVDALLELADKALYEAKGTGRNRVYTSHLRLVG